MEKPKVLILCTGNSCRSQMAEGILQKLGGDLFVVHSAGSHPAGYVHPKAVAVMGELDIDISGFESKHLDQFLESGIDTVVTVCDNAKESCPVFPGRVHRYHWSFEDPAHAEGSDEEVTEEFRRIRDQIGLVFEAFTAGYRQGKGE